MNSPEIRVEVLAPEVVTPGREALAGILLEAFSPTEGQHSMAKMLDTIDWFQKFNAQFVVAWKGDELVGMAIGFFFAEASFAEDQYRPYKEAGAKAGDYYLAFSGVKPACQHAGVWSKLTKCRMELADGATIWIATWDRNVRMLQGLANLGFVEVFRYKNWTYEDGSDKFRVLFRRAP